jgi:hypothetical protein
MEINYSIALRSRIEDNNMPAGSRTIMHRARCEGDRVAIVATEGYIRSQWRKERERVPA